MTGTNDGIYRVNLRRLALLALPTWLRGPVCSALLHAGLEPVRAALGALRAARAEASREVWRDGQVCRLRGALNDELDPWQRRVRVEDPAEGGDSARLWRRGAGAAMTVPGRIFRRGYAGAGGVDFWVAAPAELRGEDTRLRGMVDRYKPASKRYAVNYG